VCRGVSACARARAAITKTTGATSNKTINARVAHAQECVAYLLGYDPNEPLQVKMAVNLFVAQSRVLRPLQAPLSAFDLVKYFYIKHNQSASQVLNTVSSLVKCGVRVVRMPEFRAERKRLAEQHCPPVKELACTSGQRHCWLVQIADMAVALYGSAARQRYLELDTTAGAAALVLCVDNIRICTQYWELGFAYPLADRAHRHSPEGQCLFAVYKGKETNAALLELFRAAMPAPVQSIKVPCHGADCAVCRYQHKKECTDEGCPTCAYNRDRYEEAHKEEQAWAAARATATRNMISDIVAPPGTGPATGIFQYHAHF